MAVEFRVREVKRYVITRHEKTGAGPGLSMTDEGEYPNPHRAYSVAYALCRAEHEKSGEPLDSPNFIYQDTPAGFDGPEGFA